MFSKSIIIIFLIASIGTLGTSQPWMEAFDKNEEPLNFFKIQSEFESYWNGRSIERSSGWKPFKRWEWFWENRVNPDGSFPNSGLIMSNYLSYLRKYNNSNRITQANWQSLGPDFSTAGYAGLGRIASIGFHPTNVNTIFVGAAGGGFWKSTDDGNTWMTTTDNLGAIGVSGIAVHPNNPDIIYIATGDADHSDNYSIGVLKSVDGGLTFSATGLNWNTSNGRVIRRMLMDPDDPNIILVASSNGIYRTTNAGVSWAQVKTGNFYDIEFKPGVGENIWYSCTRDEVFRSSNDGIAWSSIIKLDGVNPNPPKSNRIAIAVSNANPDYVYFISSLNSNSGFNGLYRSSNSGLSFTLQSSTPNILHSSSGGSSTGGQGWYDLALTADPSNPEIIYVGGINTWKSDDGGVNWTLRSHWSGSSGVQTVHADKHVFEWNGNVLWEGNDGGVYRTPDGGVKWEHKTNGMRISQMYRIGVSQTDSKLMTGLQDNGTKLKNTNAKWSDVLGGDGMDCAVNPFNSNVLYGSSQNGNLQRSTNGGVNWTNIKNNIPGTPTGAWVTPLRIVPGTSTSLVAAFTEVYHSSDQGNTWTSIGTTADVGTSKKTILNIAPSNSNYIYTGTSSALYRTIDGGITWSTLVVPGVNIVDLIVHPTDPNTVWIVRSNYSSGQKVYKSTNGGSTWVNISGSLPNIPASSIVYQNNTQNGIYIGMDIGVYHKDDTMSDWELFSTGLPNVEVTELEIDYSNNLLYAATFGRGVWKTELINAIPTCLYPIHLSVNNISTYDLEVSWASNSGSFEGYEYAVTTTSSPPANVIFTTNLSEKVLNLSSNTEYYLHVRSKCSGLVYSQWSTEGPFRTSPACGQNMFDSGGTSANYSNEEFSIWTVCPISPCYNVRATFSSFNVEANWDALYIFNGTNVTDFMFSSGNPITSGGFPAGGYYGTSIPGTFTSSHLTGCLTFRFLSDKSTTRSGWNASISCILKDPLVVNNLDNGLGSMRNALDCIPDGNMLTFDDKLIGQNINLTSGPFYIDKNVSILQTLSSQMSIVDLSNTNIFIIQPDKELELKHVNLFPGSNSSGRAIINNGTLTLDETHIYDNLSNLGTGSTIINNGVLIIQGNSSINGN